MAANTKWKAWQFDSETDARRVRHVLEDRYPRQSFESLGDRLVAPAKVTSAELQEIADRLNIIGPTPLASLYEPRNSAGGRRNRAGTDIVWNGNVAHGAHTVGELAKGYRGWSGIVRQSFGRGSVLDSDGAPTKAEVKGLVTDMMRRWDREVELQGRAAFD